MARVAFLVDQMFEDSELRIPYDRLVAAGHRPVLVGIEAGKLLSGKKGKEKITTEVSVDEVSLQDFEALVIPGGYSPDRLRENVAMVGLVRDFCHAGRPVAAICHGGWMLAEADVLEGRTVTSWPSIRTDLINAGARWVDREVVEDGNVITSRKPDDLGAFCEALLRQIEHGAGARIVPHPSRVAVLVDQLFEDSELRVPCDRLAAAGHLAVIVGAIQSEKLFGRLRKEKVVTQLAVENASALDFDAVLIPGGYSPDRLRTNPRMVELVRDFFRAGKPVAAIGHAVSLLVEADIVDGRTVTSWPSIVADLRNAGARWIDRDVVVDGTLVTARSPEDLGAFCDVLLTTLPSVPRPPMGSPRRAREARPGNTGLAEAPVSHDKPVPAAEGRGDNLAPGRR